MKNNNRKAFTLRGFLLLSIATILFGFYLMYIFSGNNSIRILCLLKQEKKRLEDEKKRLQKENMKLQREYFQLVKMNGY
jgi:cell division protein FtsB